MSYTSSGHITILKQSIFLPFDIYGCHTADSKPVKQEVNGTVILPPLVFPAPYHPKALTENYAKCAFPQFEQKNMKIKFLIGFVAMPVKKRRRASCQGATGS